MQIYTHRLNPRPYQGHSFTFNSKPYSIVHDHDHYEITVVTKGRVAHHIGNTRQILHANTAVFFRPQDVHGFFQIGDEKLEYINMAFTAQTMQELLDYIGDGINLDNYITSPTPVIIHLTHEETNDIRSKVAEFITLPPDGLREKNTFTRMVIADLFLKYAQTQNTQNKEYPVWLYNLLAEMNDPDNFRQGVSRMEEITGKTPAYICRVFKDKLDTTPTDYVNSLRINYCASRLIHSDAEIADIAKHAGFSNLSHFYHLFKKKYHTSPSKYRAMR